MRPADLPPNHAVLAPIDFPLRFVYVCHPLAHVEFSVALLVHVLDFDEGCRLILVSLAPFVAEDAALAIERAGFSLPLHHPKKSSAH